VKSILQKSNFNPKELLSSFQKDWEILPFPYVVAKPRNLRNEFYHQSLREKTMPTGFTQITTVQNSQE
jgi:hypothetical protein